MNQIQEGEINKLIQRVLIYRCIILKLNNKIIAINLSFLLIPIPLKRGGWIIESYIRIEKEKYIFKSMKTWT